MILGQPIYLEVQNRELVLDTLIEPVEFPVHVLDDITERNLGIAI